MRVTGRLALLLATGLCIIPTITAQDLRTRVVVEQVAKNSEAETAGLQAKDILLKWNRADASGEIKSPFDLSEIETEQAPRGDVTLEGLRGTEVRTWTLGPN